MSLESPAARTLARAVLAAVLAGLSAAGAAVAGGIDAGEWIQIALSVVSAGGIWYGVGAATPLEPFLGPKGDKVSVPADRVELTDDN